ncbi:MAG: hypothetical protein ACRD0A_12705 [Acidimicrobiales bacterium]
MSQNPTAEQFGEYAKNAFYVTIGLGVLAVQQVQVQRRQFAQWLNGQATGARTSFDDLQGRLEDGVKAAEERLSALEEQAEAVLTELQGRLPESVKELAEQSIDYATQARAELFDLFGFTSATPSKPAKSSGSTKAA